MTDKFKINVKQADLDKLDQFLRGRIRNLVLEHAHIFDPGNIAGAMSDLRALAFIEPSDKAAAPPPAKAGPTRAEYDAQQQRENQALDKKERDRNQAAG